MNIIVNKNRELRATNIPSIGCNLLDMKFYISKDLVIETPIYCVVDDNEFLLYKIEEGGNYDIYGVIDLFNVNFEQKERALKILFNNEETEEIKLFFSEFKRDTLEQLLINRRAK